MIIYYIQDGKTFVGELMIKAEKKKILKPGSRGGQYYIDKQGVVRYGARPLSKKGKGDSKKQMGLFSSDTELTAKRSDSDYLGMKPEKKVDKNKPRKQMDLFSGKQAEKPKEPPTKLTPIQNTEKPDKKASESSLTDNEKTILKILVTGTYRGMGYKKIKISDMDSIFRYFFIQNNKVFGHNTGSEDYRKLMIGAVHAINSLKDKGLIRSSVIGQSDGYGNFVDSGTLEPNITLKEFRERYEKESPVSIKINTWQREEPPKSTPIQDMAAKVNKPAGKEPWEMTQEEFVDDETNKLKKLRQISLDQVKDDINKLPVKNLTVGLSKIQWLLTLPQKNKEQKELFHKYNIAKNNVDADYRADQSVWKRVHKTMTIRAVSEGKPVPAEVLADYPDLKKPAEPKPETPIKDMAEKVGAVKNNKKKRFEAGKKLSPEEKHAVYRQMKDAYKENRRPYHMEDTERGERKVWDGNASDYMETSDITGARLRWYIPIDGGIAHPTELYPNIALSEIQRAEHNIEYYERYNEQDIEKTYKILNKNGEVPEVINSIETALKNGFFFEKQYDSNDVGKRKPITFLHNGKNNIFLPVSRYHVMNREGTFGGLSQADYVEYKSNRENTTNVKYLPFKFDIDWETFYNRYKNINEQLSNTKIKL